MKRITLLLLLALAAASCGNDKKISRTEKNADGTTTTTTMNLAGMSGNADAMTQKMEALKKLQPLNLEQLKALLPEAVNGIPRSSFNTNSMMGFGVAEAEYKQNDKDLKVAIYDCAGEAGAGIFALSYLTQMNMQSESENGYTKTLNFNGAKAIESYDKNSSQSTFTYLSGDRLMVVLTGRNMDNATLKQVAQSLSLKV